MTLVDFMGKATHFLGIKFQWDKYTNNNTKHLKAHLSQSAYVELLIELAQLSNDVTTNQPTSYRTGLPVDNVRNKQPPTPEQQAKLQHCLRQLVGSPNWLSQGTRPDLFTITSFLVAYQNRASQGHFNATKHTVQYIQCTKDLGIVFDSNTPQHIHSYIQK